MGNEQKETDLTSPSVKLILNGGGRIMDNATIPVEWHFSQELIELDPKWILICEHDGPGQDLKDNLMCRGRRYAFKVTDRIAFIPLLSRGVHHIYAEVFYGKHATRMIEDYCEKEPGSSKYQQPVSDSGGFATITSEDFEVPKELFAQRPETGFKKLLWKWVNGWYTFDPRDECDYRKRMLFAFTLKPPLFLIGFLVSRIILSLYVILGSLFIAFIGFRPVPVFSNLKNLWLKWYRYKGNLLRYSGLSKNDAWLLWEYDGYYGSRKEVPIFLVPIFLIIETLWVYGVFSGLYALITENNPLLFVITIVVFLALIFGIIKYIKWYNNEERATERRARKREKQNEKREKEEEKERERNTEFFKKISLSSAPKKVDAKEVIREISFISNPVLKFKLSFSAAKAKVCKPFAK